jgi:transketolase
MDINSPLCLDKKIVNTLRCLSVDMVNQANSGHPGMPLGFAPVMFVLWCKIMNFNPENPLWELRDRFILSNGHGCALLYSMLYLIGYDYTIDDLKHFRQLHSKTPGHPEFNKELGIEISTGPLGQGIANGVGMAIASKKMNIDNHIYVMCGDGCLMEGISYEAASIAGHLGLNNLIILYDDNGITIDGKTDITFTEDTRKRFNALQWNVLDVNNGDSDIDDIYDKINLAKKEETKPTIVFIKNTIGYGSSLSGKSSVHGAPLGMDKTQNLKTVLGVDPNLIFHVDPDVIEYFKKLKQTKIEKYNLIGDKPFNVIEDDINEVSIELKNIKNLEKNIATREASLLCLNVLAENMKNIIIGSADLAESNKMLVKLDVIDKNNRYGNIINYGVREHSMVAIANGISTYGILPIVGTFLVFINYCLCAIRMSALSKHKVIFVFTHDSILLGEDGPTHQPIESLTILRSIPDLLTVRPCDTTETSGAYQIAMENEGPTAIILSRQTVINNKNSNIDLVKRGAYIVNEPIGEIDLIIVSTGSEVSLVVEVIDLLKDKYNIRLVSMPCTNLFDIQDEEYKNNILPKNIKSVSIEAGCTMCWYKYVDHVYGIDKFGASGNITDLKKHYGFDKDSVISFILSILN